MQVFQQKRSAVMLLECWLTICLTAAVWMSFFKIRLVSNSGEITETSSIWFKMNGFFANINFSFLQLVILMALAKGKSQITCGHPTLHTQTSIHIAETLTKVSISSASRRLSMHSYSRKCFAEQLWIFVCPHQEWWLYVFEPFITKISTHLFLSALQAKFQTRQLEGDRYLIECDGIGAENMQICWTTWILW